MCIPIKVFFPRKTLDVGLDYVDPHARDVYYINTSDWLDETHQYKFYASPEEVAHIVAAENLSTMEGLRAPFVSNLGYHPVFWATEPVFQCWCCQEDFCAPEYCFYLFYNPKTHEVQVMMFTV